MAAVLWDFTTSQRLFAAQTGTEWRRVKKQVALLDLVVAEWLREGVSEMTAGGLGGEGHKRLFVLAAELGSGSFFARQMAPRPWPRCRMGADMKAPPRPRAG